MCYFYQRKVSHKVLPFKLIQSAYNVKQPHQNEDGFVLIEILSALIIIGIASIAFLHISSSSASHMRRAKTTFDINHYAQSLLDDERLKASAEFRDVSKQDLAQKMDYSISVSPLDDFTEVNAEQPILAMVKVQVRPIGTDNRFTVSKEVILTYGQAE